MHVSPWVNVHAESLLLVCLLYCVSMQCGARPSGPPSAAHIAHPAQPAAGGTREIEAAGQEAREKSLPPVVAGCEPVAVGSAHCHTRDVEGCEKSPPLLSLPPREIDGQRLEREKSQTVTTELDDGLGQTLRGSWTEACKLHNSPSLWPNLHDSSRDIAAVGQGAREKSLPPADVSTREIAGRGSTFGTGDALAGITDTAVSEPMAPTLGSAAAGTREIAAAATHEGSSREIAAAHTSLDDSACRHAESSSKGLGCARSAEAGRSREPSLMPMPTKPAAIALPCAPGPRALVGAAGRRLDVARAALKTPALARSLSGTVPGAPRAIDALGQPLPVPAPAARAGSGATRLAASEVAKLVNGGAVPKPAARPLDSDPARLIACAIASRWVTSPPPITAAKPLREPPSVTPAAVIAKAEAALSPKPIVHAEGAMDAVSRVKARPTLHPFARLSFGRLNIDGIPREGGFTSLRMVHGYRHAVRMSLVSTATPDPLVGRPEDVTHTTVCRGDDDFAPSPHRFDLAFKALCKAYRKNKHEDPKLLRRRVNDAYYDSLRSTAPPPFWRVDPEWFREQKANNPTLQSHYATLHEKVNAKTLHNRVET